MFEMPAQCTEICKKLLGQTSFQEPKFSFELFKTLILNFACIRSKSRKLLSVLILYQNTPILFIEIKKIHHRFAYFFHFCPRDMSRDHNQRGSRSSS